MRKINLLYLMTTLQPLGGAESALENIVQYIDKTKFNIFVAAVFKKGDKQLKIDLPDENIIYFNFSSRYYADIKGFSRLVKFIRSNRIDVIHTHLFAANTVGRIAGFCAKVPVTISTEHNTYLKRNSKLHLVDKILSLFTTRIIAVSESVLKYSSEATGIDKGKYLYIPNCVPIDKIHKISKVEAVKKRKELNLLEGQPVILSVGRLTEQKDYPTLINAAQIVIKQYPAVMFLIAGKGELYDQLNEKIVTLGLQENVKLLGFRADIYELMQISNILAMPSLWEGLPVTLIEAGACGLPVIATAVGGIKEIIADNENGLIVPIGDCEKLAGAIGSLLDNPEFLKRMQENAKHIVEQKFSGPIVATQLENLYQQCLNEAKARWQSK